MAILFCPEAAALPAKRGADAEPEEFRSKSGQGCIIAPPGGHNGNSSQNGRVSVQAASGVKVLDGSKVDRDRKPYNLVTTPGVKFPLKFRRCSFFREGFGVSDSLSLSVFGWECERTRSCLRGSVRRTQIVLDSVCTGQAWEDPFGGVGHGDDRGRAF